VLDEVNRGTEPRVVANAIESHLGWLATNIATASELGGNTASSIEAKLVNALVGTLEGFTTGSTTGEGAPKGRTTLQQARR
jgi:hypothetical protein